MTKESILIIDTDENSTYLLTLLIQRLGYRFKVTEDSKKGFNELKEGSFTLVIADVSLFEANQIMKTQEAHPNVCFIFTGDSAERFKDHIKPGISDFLSKPLLMEEAEYRLKRIIVDRDRRFRYEDAERQLQSARQELDRKNKNLESSMEDLERIKRLYKEIGKELNTTSEKLRRAKDKLEVLAITDGLTEVHNHRYFMEQIHERFGEAKELQTPLSLLMIDIDHFKAFNDNHGHMTGDLVLKVIAHILKSSCRSEDIVARYGGEEFAIILPDTNANEAQLVAERIRTAVENHPPPNGRQAHLVTVSIGISSTEAAGIDTVDNLISLADRALYRAKTEGRNRVRAYKDDPELERPIPFAHG